MRESCFWGKHLRPYFKSTPGLIYTRHEDDVTAGIPDISFTRCGVSGWIELKAYDEWPKREKTLIRFDNFTDQQRSFLTKRGEAGANCFLIACIGRDVLVFPWTSLEGVGSTNRSDLVGYTSWMGKLPIKGHSLADTLFTSQSSSSLTPR